MIPHAPALDAAYGAQAWEPYVSVVPIGSDGTEGAALTPTGGQLTRDMTSWPRDQASIVLPAGLTPELTRLPVTPYGGQIAIDLGARIGGALFTYRACVLDVSDGVIRRPDGSVELSAVSHEARVNEDRYDTVDSTGAGTSQSVITFLVRRALGASFPVSFPGPGQTLAAGAFPLDGDVWPTIEAVADQAGWDVRFTPGGLIVRADPVVALPAAVTMNVSNGGQITGYDSTRRWAPNRVSQVYLTPTDPITRRIGTWEDTDPLSPTRISGPYGRHTRVDRITVDTLPSGAFAAAAAASVAKRSRPFRQVTIRAIPAGWLEPGDTVAMRLLGGTELDLLLTGITFPLDQLDVAVLTTADTSDTSET